MTIDFGLRFLVEPTTPVLSADEKRDLSELRPAGVILRSRNFVQDAPYSEWLETCATLLRDVREAIGRERIIVSVDHEGGRVHRFPPPITRFPYAAFYGMSLDAVRAVANAMAVELKSLGINLSFAPVADIHSNPNNQVIYQRAFGQTAEAVAQSAVACADALRRGGILPCAKHFPGHGDTSVDSHLALPVLDLSREQLFARELVPFKELIDHGIEAIMTAHIVVPQIDPSNQATVSPVFIKSILRDELGFDGVAIADALGMSAIREDAGQADFAVRAHHAGLDLFLFAGDPVTISDARAVCDSLRTAHQSGAIDSYSLLESQSRIERLLSRLPQHNVVALPREVFEQNARLASTLSKNDSFADFAFEPEGFM